MQDGELSQAAQSNWPHLQGAHVEFCGGTVAPNQPEKFHSIAKSSRVC